MSLPFHVLLSALSSGGGLVPSSDIQLLLHFDGTNGATTFTDSSIYNRTVSRQGISEISTAQSKWGVSSLYTPNNVSGISVAHNSVFNLSVGGTIEWWANPQEFTGGEEQHITKWGSANGYQWASGHIGSNGQAYFYIQDAASNFFFWQSSAGVVVNNNTFKHFAIQVSGSSPSFLFQMWVNGTRVIRQINGNGVKSSGTAPLRVGVDDDLGSSGHQCYFDEVVFFQTPKYGDVATITVPTGPYP